MKPLVELFPKEITQPRFDMQELNKMSLTTKGKWQNIFDAVMLNPQAINQIYRFLNFSLHSHCSL